MENQPREAKKKSVGSNTKGRGSQPSRGGSSGASAQPQPPFGYTTQPPFFYQQPSHPSFYNTQPQPPFGYFQNVLSMDPQAPAFDPFGFRSPQVPSPRENVERPLPIYEDEEEEVVPETQNLGDYEDDTGDDEYNVNEDAGNDARGKKTKMERQSWSKYQEEALAKAWVHCSTDKKKGNQQTRDGFWRKILDHYNATVGGSNRTVHQDRTRESGCNDLNVMKIALKDFQNKYPSGFQHVEAWEVVRKHDKWAQVPLLGEEGEGSAQKRKSVDVDPSIPDMNEDPSPQSTQRRDKRQATSSEGSAELAAQFKEYTAMKEAKHVSEMEASELRKKRESEARDLITEQRETMKNTRTIEI
ncbi:putative glutathione transferase [Helianthus annuus]|nr:putative glutathione transferase [Helianthus annuus]KAJ0583641.1 putative glutathione transferase [Helianthus annuus]